MIPCTFSADLSERMHTTCLVHDVTVAYCLFKGLYGKHVTYFNYFAYLNLNLNQAAIICCTLLTEKIKVLVVLNYDSVNLTFKKLCYVLYLYL